MYHAQWLPSSMRARLKISLVRVAVASAAPAARVILDIGSVQVLPACAYRGSVYGWFLPARLIVFALIRSMNSTVSRDILPTVGFYMMELREKGS
jgi:hypothetical protein